MARKAVFFDRDDTLIDGLGNIQRPDQVKLLPGIPDALIQLKKMGYLLIVITNQPGIAKGLLTKSDLDEIHLKLKKLLAAEDAVIDDLYYCPYHPEGTIKNFSIDSNLRKPNAGMLFKAEEDHNVDLNESWVIGDSYRDIAAGQAAGCHTILVDVPGKLREKKKDDPEPDRKAVNLREAVNIIRMYEFHQKAQKTKNAPIDKQKSNVKISLERDKENSSPTQVDNQLNSEPRQETIPGPNPSQKTEPEHVPRGEISTSKESTPTNRHQNIQSEDKKTVKVYTTRELPTHDLQTDVAPESKTHQMLEELLHRMRNKDREGLYREFSVFKLLSLMIQVIAIFCLIVSVFFWLNPKVMHESVLIMIGYAIILQLIVIALQLMHSND